MNSQIAKIGFEASGTKGILGGENYWVSLYQVSGSGVITTSSAQGFSPSLTESLKGLTLLSSSDPVEKKVEA